MLPLPSSAFWHNKRVFLTGHTGFKGSWLTLWLNELGAKVRGYALAPETTPSMFTALGLSNLCEHIEGDIRNRAALTDSLRGFKPDIVIHMAAQALVRRGFRTPIETFETNAMGTANILEAARDLPGLKSIVIVTTDKCYENREWVYPYREVDPLGGHDPYSASKAAAELITSSYRRSFYHTGEAAVASARAGNVIGGGDWSEDRLIVDAVKAYIARRPMIVRNIKAVRPWQHVLEPLSGYLTLAQALYERNREISPSFNFGPPAEQVLSVGDMIESVTNTWGDGAAWKHDPPPNAPHEAGLLMLDPSLAMRELNWRPRWRFAKTIEATVEWYKHYYAKPEEGRMLALTRAQIADYRRE